MCIVREDKPKRTKRPKAPVKPEMSMEKLSSLLKNTKSPKAEQQKEVFMNNVKIEPLIDIELLKKKNQH